MPELSVASVEAFIRANHAWAAAAALGLCLVRSTVIVGLFVPATAILVAIGGLVGAGLVGWYELVLAGVLGCTLGDHLSFWVGRGLGPGARKVWPLRTRPEIVAKGEAFFLKHGWWGVFVARFFTRCA
jgi:membrane protein DedA with SNARE-associated domain